MNKEAIAENLKEFGLSPDEANTIALYMTVTNSAVQTLSPRC